MSQCNFEIPFIGTAEELINKANQAIVKAGGEVIGDTTEGDFSIPSPLGKITGNYKISLQTAFFNITDKPMFVGCGLIESTINSFLTK